MIDDASAALGETTLHSLANDLRDGRSAALERASQRIAPAWAESDGPDIWLLAWFEGETVVIDHDQGPAAANHRARRREIERDNGDLFLMDVEPNVELGPVRERKHADAFAFPLAAVVKAPRLGALS